MNTKLKGGLNVNEKSTPTNLMGVPSSPTFTKVLDGIRELSVSELQSVLIEIAFLIRQKTVEELLAMLRKEQDAKPTDTNGS